MEDTTIEIVDDILFSGTFVVLVETDVVEDGGFKVEVDNGEELGAMTVEELVLDLDVVLVDNVGGIVVVVGFVVGLTVDVVVVALILDIAAFDTVDDFCRSWLTPTPVGVGRGVVDTLVPPSPNTVLKAVVIGLMVVLVVFPRTLAVPPLFELDPEMKSH